MRLGLRMIAILAVAALVAGCGDSGDTGDGGSSAAGSSSPAVFTGAPPVLEGAELQYGTSAAPTDEVVLQPDVVVLPGGAGAIVEASSDGMIWTLDGDAEGVGDLQQGDLLLATSLAAGRVLGIEEVGGNRRVALGPAAITDIIRDGDFSVEQPVSVENFAAYSTPDAPGLETETEGEPEPGEAEAGAVQNLRGGRHRSAALPMQPKLPPMPMPSVKPPTGAVGGWRTTPICCTDNGVHVTYDQNGARIQATAGIKFTTPSVTFRLKIGGGTLIDAAATLNGAASLKFGISAAVENSAASFRGGRVQVPVNIQIPVPIAGIPFTIGFQQIFSINLGLSGKAWLATEGEYAIGGSLGFSVRNGSPKVETPTFTTKNSALQNINSLAVAPSGLTFAYALKTSIGVGVPGLSAGIWYQFSAALGFATSGAQLDPIQGTSLVTCKTVSLSVLGRYGVGFTIPKLVARALNFFLNDVLKVKVTPIPETAGPSWGPTTFFNESTPPCSSARGQG